MSYEPHQHGRGISSRTACDERTLAAHLPKGLSWTSEAFLASQSPRFARGPDLRHLGRPPASRRVSRGRLEACARGSRGLRRSAAAWLETRTPRCGPAAPPPASEPRLSKATGVRGQPRLVPRSGNRSVSPAVARLDPGSRPPRGGSTSSPRPDHEPAPCRSPPDQRGKTLMCVRVQCVFDDDV